MGQIGPTHLLVVAVVVLVVFGSKRLPDTARALGKSLRILKSETAALRTDDQPQPPVPAPPSVPDVPAAREQRQPPVSS
ncbi:Sec-independent protein translocase subunit TatA [Streptomyces carpaticus]|uniref:Sec-independent protein translocase protein TatA n=2 Tax=Streptomyces TaxID=1883 RepID=A0A1I6VPY1_9ACTN|nr:MULTISPECIES: Sec-independent protein translocase subunit TatA [Streptomyces]QKV71803.1 Sec-independent protein translocase subunit TatA [Streptomyces harbinensis]UWM52299.1 Sec-independent protein translocase subunit TatA [Streptomyces carpaticus]SFT15484.1 sec-independent protein translocase protein TatA [Streptomyces harbinensis]